MKIWNYIGEFILFRWLLDKFRKSTTEHDTHTEHSGTSIERDHNHLNDNLEETNAPIDNAVTVNGDNLIDDSDNYDDLDIFMRDNQVNNPSCLHDADYKGDYHRNSRASNNNDWFSKSYNHSIDNFHHEQDDYDMFDDL